MYKIRRTTKFKKDFKLISKRKYDITLFEKVVSILMCGETLPEKYKDHALTGNYLGYRECHIKPDWLLVYKIDKNILVLVLSRTGTHSDLFNK